MASYNLNRCIGTYLGRQAPRLPFGALLATLACGCGQPIASAEQPASVTLEARPAARGSDEDLGASGQDLGAPELNGAPEHDLGAPEHDPLRRGYGALDMRFNACVTRKNDFTLEGEGCSPGFSIYGPYVPVPANTELDVSFEVTASARVEIYSDIVSQMGGRTLAGLNRHVIDPGTKHRLGYRVRVFDADTNVESRIGLSLEPTTRFEVSHLTMTVR